MSRQPPLLTIGIIFKNEIRCLERCLKSLQPLRDAIPSELVMADTGSDDGSRAVAERYADILIDFPWTGDFSAARNAVMDHSSGAWYMSIDCDEWVDENIEGFVTFLNGVYDFDFASVIIRNYDTPKLDKGGSYSDFLGTRLLRMSTGLRYEGTIHEHWHYSGDLRTMMIRGAIFHHDGYVYQNTEMLKAKQKRNMPLLRQQLADDPENLIILNQCVESSAETPEQEGYLRRALAGVTEHWSQWEMFGPPIYRYAVRMALRDSLPELEEWINQAETMFPDSIFVRVEIAYFTFGYYWNADNYAKAIYWGERYLQGVADYHTGQFNRVDLLASSLDKTDAHSRLSVAVVLAEGYLHEKQPEKCAQLLDRLDPGELEARQIEVCVQNLCRLHSAFGWDTEAQVLRFWDRLSEPARDQKSTRQQQAAFIQAGSAIFSRKYRETETADVQFTYYSYTTFLPLAGRCGLGTAAAILESGDRVEIERLLRTVDDWGELPIAALERALLAGVAFPLPDRPLKLEEMDGLAARLAQGGEHLTEFLDKAVRAMDEDPQTLAWTRGLALAALRVQDWEAGGDGMNVIKAFAAVERAFLPQYYAPAMLCGETVCLLPPMHRFGWYCVQAFDTLDAGGKTGYVRLLREGLESCAEAKPIVEFLLGQLEKSQQVQAVPELIVLAEQVRTLLAQYPADDPAVEALKQSAAYQKVAHLIEGPELGVFGGFAQ